MRAMILHAARQPLQLTDWPRPEPGLGELLLRVEACAVCRTDLHVVDGELSDPLLPLVPGHEIVGRIVQRGRAGMPSSPSPTSASASRCRNATMPCMRRRSSAPD
jgi:propanol-preferring alcohol dehydrogenase